MIFLCSSYKSKGRFLLWTYEIWSIGGGSGLQWYFMGKEVCPGKYFIGWLFVRSEE